MGDQHDNHILCYVKEPWAYFTNQPLAEQWGDDWDDAPYEHNAEPPYSDSPGQIVKVAYYANFEEPHCGQCNSPYSVKDINNGHIAWLRPSRHGNGGRAIPAGTTLRNFIEIIESSGGEVYLRHEAESEGRDG